MSNQNTTTLVGNLTRDPELKFTPAAKAVVEFGLAVNRRWQVGDEWKEEASFFNVNAWESLAENIAESLVKGDRVIVVGELRQRSWETDDGQKRSVVEVKATSVGPDLTWATAKPVRNEKKGGGTSNQAPHPADIERGEPF